MARAAMGACMCARRRELTPEAWAVLAGDAPSDVVDLRRVFDELHMREPARSDVLQLLDGASAGDAAAMVAAHTHIVLASEGLGQY